MMDAPAQPPRKPSPSPAPAKALVFWR